MCLPCAVIVLCLVVSLLSSPLLFSIMCCRRCLRLFQKKKKHDSTSNINNTQTHRLPSPPPYPTSTPRKQHSKGGGGGKNCTTKREQGGKALPPERRNGKAAPHTMRREGTKQQAPSHKKMWPSGTVTQRFPNETLQVPRTISGDEQFEKIFFDSHCRIHSNAKTAPKKNMTQKNQQHYTLSQSVLRKNSRKQFASTNPKHTPTTNTQRDKQLINISRITCQRKCPAPRAPRNHCGDVGVTKTTSDKKVCKEAPEAHLLFRMS